MLSIPERAAPASVPFSGSPLRAILWSAACGWTLLLFSVMAVEVASVRRDVEENARTAARSAYRTNILYRRWAARQGGVYVPVSAQNPVNPNLSLIPERDVTTPSGRVLTLLNPDIMMRQVQSDSSTGEAPSGRLTALKPIRKENAPNPWEKKALESLTSGSPEVVSIDDVDGERHMRYMGPLAAEASCLKCHMAERFIAGTVQGGISLSLPLREFYSQASRHSRFEFAALGGVWIIGLLGLAFSGHLLKRHRREQEASEAAIQRSESKFRTVSEFGAEWESWIAPDGSYLYISPACERISGYSPQAFLDDPELFTKLVHAEDLPAWEAHRDEGLRAGASTSGGSHLEFRILRKDGEVRWIEHVCQGVHDSHQGFLGRRSSNRDATARKEVAHQLEEEQHRLRMILDHAPIGIWLLGGDGRLQFVNRAFCDTVGIPEERFLAVPHYAELYPPEIAASCTASDEAAFSSTSPHVSHEHLLLADGTWHDLEITKVRLGASGDQPVGLIALSLDVTEKRKAEEALRASEEWFRSIAETSRDLIVLASADGIITYVSPASTRLFGPSPGEMTGTRFLDFVDPSDGENASSKLAAILAGVHQPAFVLKLKRRDGSTFFGEASGTLSRFGPRSGALLIVRDITERVEREAQLLQAQKMESIGRLAGGVAHDFNNMLQVVLMNASMAIEEAPSHSQLRDYLEAIEDVARRSAGLTAQLLAFARKQPIRPRSLVLNDAVSGTLRLLQRLIGENIQLTWSPGQSLWPVNADPAQIDQILTNLAVNARDAIGGVGTIAINTSNATLNAGPTDSQPECKAGDYVMLSVTDSGRGMTKQEMAHMFEPFFTTKGLGRGTGLGLATVFGIVKQNGGTIDVSSELGRGTTVSVYLPRSRQETSPPGSERANPRLRGTETVLLVEDEEGILQTVKRTLEENGYRVLAAGSPQEALRLASESKAPVSLLLTDVVMPGMDGGRLRKEIESLHPRARCLFMSGYAASVIGDQLEARDSAGFLQKPFAATDLLKKVRDVLEGH